MVPTSSAGSGVHPTRSSCTSAVTGPKCQHVDQRHELPLIMDPVPCHQVHPPTRSNIVASSLSCQLIKLGSVAVEVQHGAVGVVACTCDTHFLSLQLG